MRSINKIIAVLLVMVMTLSILPVSAFTASAATTSDPAPSVSAAIKRLGGADRYETSTKIAQEGWTSADTVVLASADSYADALAGAPLARAKDAPIMLVSGKSVNAKVMAQIKALGAKTVYLLGGTAAISAEIEAELTKAGYTVIRLWDSTRYGTAVAVAKELVKINGNPSEVFIASGVNYPDALSASSIAGIKGVPILYAPANGVLDDATIAFIKSAAPGKAFILGGTAAIDNAVVGKLTEAGVASTERLGGNDRYDTSLIITKKFDSLFTSKDISIATGKNYPDALAGGAFSAKKGIPVLLTDNATVNSDLKAYIAGKDPAVAYVFGGESVVSDAIVKAYLPVPAPTTTTTESTTTATTAAPSTPATPAPVPSITRYKVTFEANGDNVENMPAEQKVKKNQCATEPAEPTREGYTFGGWYTEAECVNEFDFATKITKKITLYAKWVSDSGSITIEIDKDAFTFDDALGVYTLDSKLHGLTGTLSSTKNITSISYRLSTHADAEIAVGEIPPAETWSIDVGLIVGYNVITVQAMCDENVIASDQIEVVNASQDNETALGADAEDQDSDGLPKYAEVHFGSKDDKDDTDGDGLSDYNEIVDLGTDPSLNDSDNDGTSDEDEDHDGDGLTNGYEYAIGTSPITVDSDYDGLRDNEEITTYLTDPTKLDTDDDGMDDGWEIENGFDPLKADASFKIERTVGEPGSEVTVEIELDPILADSLTVKESTDYRRFSMGIPGYISPAYDFNVDGSFEKATLKFSFDPELLNDPSFVPVIYYYNEETGLLEEIPTTISGNTAIAEVTHFSTYILLNKTKFDEAWEDDIKPPAYVDDDRITSLDVVFVVDSSGSMSSNDKTKIRHAAAKQFIDKLGENDRAAVVDFDSSARLYQAFTSNHDLLYAAIDRIDSSGNTNLSSGISSAINQFTNDSYTKTDAYKYVVFLTDGNGTYDTSYTQSAIDNGIVIYTIGLGSGVKESILRPIAENTGGKYFFASTATELPDIYEDVSFETVDYTSDSNDDGITDYHTKLMCDGSLRSGTGKRIFLAGSYDDVQKNDDFDQDGIKNGDELDIRVDIFDSSKVYVEIISDPTLVDSDFDGNEDGVEEYYGTDPLEYNISIYDKQFSGVVGPKFDYQIKYEKDFGFKALMNIGNWFYGSNYDYTVMYKSALSSFFNSIADETYLEKSIETENDLQFKEMLQMYSDSISGADNFAGITDIALVAEYYSYNKGLNSIINKLASGEISRIDARASLHSLNSSHTSLTDSIESAAKKIKGVEGAKWAKNLETGSFVVFTLWDMLESGIEGYEMCGEIEANLSIMDDNCNMLDILKNSSEAPTTLRNAASELYLLATDQLDENVFTVRTVFKNVSYAGISSVAHFAITKIPYIGFWIELGRSIANLIVPVEEASRMTIEMYGLAKSTDIVYDNITNTLNGKYITDDNGHIRYTVYGKENASVAARGFFNTFMLRSNALYKAQAILNLDKKNKDKSHGELGKQFANDANEYARYYAE